MTIKPRPYQIEAIKAGYSKSIEDRFWDKVLRYREDECWAWIGAKNEKGYGIIGRGPSSSGVDRAHRVSWFIHFGPIPDGLVVCHKCDNPECTNPKHLFLGTLIDNNADMKAKGRHVHGECSYSKLTRNDVEEIKLFYSTGEYSQYKLAKIYHISRSMIQLIVTGKRWVNA